MVPKLGNVQRVLWASFQVCFLCEIFFDFWCHLRFRLAPTLRKKTFRKSLQKKGAPLSQTSDYDHGPRLPDSPPRVRTCQTRNNSSSSKCCSNSCPCLWFRTIVRKLLFELASIAHVSKKNRKIEKARCIIQRASPLVIWHTLGRGPANMDIRWFQIESQGISNRAWINTGALLFKHIPIHLNWEKAAWHWDGWPDEFRSRQNNKSSQTGNTMTENPQLHPECGCTQL